MFEFKIIEESRPEAMADKVQDAAVDGWEPLGGVAVLFVDQYYNKRFYQSMIRQIETKVPKKR